MTDPRKRFLTFCCVALLTGCGRNIPTPGERFLQARNLAATDVSLHEQIYRTSDFSLLAFQSALEDCRGETLHVYIEGDGLAWITPSLVSSDPTPINPLALKLAVQDSAQCRIYLARPCQYLGSDTACDSRYWTSHRFSTTVVDSYSEVFDTIKKHYDVSSFTLFGYSGGGTIATLLAARREDVAELISVAGNLDTAHWARRHSLTPLYGSLNPADYAAELENIEQIHLLGGKDTVIDTSEFSSYHNHFKDKSRIRSRVFPGFDHACCWDKEWPAILQELEQ